MLKNIEKELKRGSKKFKYTARGYCCMKEESGKLLDKATKRALFSWGGAYSSGVVRN